MVWLNSKARVNIDICTEVLHPVFNLANANGGKLSYPILCDNVKIIPDIGNFDLDFRLKR